MAKYIQRMAVLDAIAKRITMIKEELTPTTEKSPVDIFLLGLRHGMWLMETIPDADVQEVIHARWKCTSIGNYACSFCGEEPPLQRGHPRL